MPAVSMGGGPPGRLSRAPSMMSADRVEAAGSADEVAAKFRASVKALGTRVGHRGSHGRVGVRMCESGHM